MPNPPVPASGKGLPTDKRRARKLPPSRLTVDDVVSGRVSRQALEDEIERLIGLLDVADPDPDLEPSIGHSQGYAYDAEGDFADDEFSLGSLDRQMDQTNWPGGRNTDAELDRADSEPSLGSPAGGIGNQERWAQGLDAELNGDEEDENGDELDENGDERDLNGDEADCTMAEDDWAWDGNRPAASALEGEAEGYRVAVERLAEIVDRLKARDAEISR